MKKENKKIIIVVGIIGLCILSGYFVIKNNYNVSSNVADKSNTNNETENINLGDDCGYCMTMCSRGSNPSSCNSACASACAGTSKTYCCCNSSRTSCSNSSSCTGPGEQTVAINISASACATYARSGSSGSSGGDDSGSSSVPSITSVSISPKDGHYFAADEISGLFGTATASGATPTGWSAKGNFSISGSGNKVNINFGNVGIGSGTTPAENTLSVTAKNSSSSKTSSTTTVYVYSCGWKSAPGSWLAAGRKDYDKDRFTSPGCDFFSEKTTENGVEYYKRWHGRCCTNATSSGGSSSGSSGGSSGGSSNTPTPPVEDFGHCYGDSPYMVLAKTVKWHSGPVNSKYGYLYKDITDISKCKTLDIGKSCTIKPKGSRTTTNAPTCESKLDFKVTGGKICSNFYSYSCTTNVITEFDMDDNIVKSNYNMYGGLGFKFNINITEEIECKAEFHLSEWEKAYNKVMSIFKAVGHSSIGTAYAAYMQNNANKFDSYADKLKNLVNAKNDDDRRAIKSRLMELYYTAKEIEKIVDDYNKVTIKENSKPTATLKLSYLDKGNNKKINDTHTFESEITDCNPIKNVTKTHSNIKKSASWITPPQDYVETYKRSINLYPESVLISKTTGEILKKTTTETKVLDGGNKIYISNNAAPGTIKLEIEVKGLAQNDSIVNNKSCSLNIIEKSLIYRPIDVTNPFIDSSWKKGENWVNTLYDFTKTIHANTWSEKSIYTISLPASMISALKTSNANNRDSDPYLGLCNRQKFELQDAVTKKLCSLIK